MSYMRKEFRATAEARKRPPLLAEAMVDADVEIPGVIDKGKLLTLTTDEALQHQVADVRAESIDAVLKFLELAGAGWASAARRHPPCGRPVWPTSRASAWMWCPTGNSSTPERPSR